MRWFSVFAIAANTFAALVLIAVSLNNSDSSICFKPYSETNSYKSILCMASTSIAASTPNTISEEILGEFV
jgi:hypothetical protein